jgi:hypothetical protein
MERTYQDAPPKNYGSGSLGLPQAATQLSPLSNVIEGLRRKAASLEQLYEGLQQKLSPILVSVPEGPPTKDGGISGPQSSVVMELQEIEYRLGILCRKIDLLITRVEA